MVLLTALFSFILASGLALAQRDPHARINKPALRNNLDDLRPGLLDALPMQSVTAGGWSEGWIPESCKWQADNIAHVNPRDLRAHNVWYDDCPNDPWTFCVHKDSPLDIFNLAFQFGRLPIQMREWVRHVIFLPGQGGSAYEYDGTLVFTRPIDDMIAVFIHETAHSMDMGGAYRERPMSSSSVFWDAFDRDSHVPDPYSQSNMIENVAQNTVIAVFNENIWGGIGTKEPNWRSIQNQYFELINQAKIAGQGNSLYNRGKAGQCTRRLPSTYPVNLNAKKRNVHGAREEEWPTVTIYNTENFDGGSKVVPVNVTLSNDVVAIDTGRTTKEQKHSECNLHW